MYHYSKMLAQLEQTKIIFFDLTRRYYSSHLHILFLFTFQISLVSILFHSFLYLDYLLLIHLQVSNDS